MTACFHLVCTQKIDIDETKSVITFSTETINGHTYYLHLTRNQFFALDDAFALFENNKSFYNTNIPLGDNLWFRHNYHASTIYNATHYGQSYFKFINFEIYKTRIHARVMSFLRSRSKPKVTLDRGVKRARLASTTDDDTDGAGPSANRQRPLSVAVRPASTSATITDIATQRATSYGAANNVIVPNAGKTRHVLPERDDSSVGRKNVPSAFSAATSADSESADDILLNNQWCDSCVVMDCE